MSDCKHKNWRWVADKAEPNEQGWYCLDCDEPDMTFEEAGYNPVRDKKKINDKVFDILQSLSEDEAGLLLVGSGSHGDGLVGWAALRCKETGRFDQTSILRFLLEADDDDGEFWKTLGDKLRDGEDPRNRCYCGEISKISSSNCGGSWNYWCSFECQAAYPAEAS